MSEKVTRLNESLAIRKTPYGWLVYETIDVDDISQDPYGDKIILDLRAIEAIATILPFQRTIDAHADAPGESQDW